ncbi:pre-rRNA 2'-O-ribose RNA methyltransferase FTSJ3 [Contarinia nasturtii]|uniref:pre-rRNA 2'-O-ribose RNA methyltransferase FTSJ3 n=1 Tax=Contarinia nasturtii TaxID=265458 RepID=UPI0012D47A5D|nr:pre-rRNA 2'-O-ribose RNA methyltransferase FTSJ3 [Contarinia nasturtii]
MGKKGKVGKDRKDKFYKLAKETGFRSRAAFKLIQLNRKFNFLQKSQVCIDLCAAPGGWMQVAKENMPISSIVIGVDLYPIKSINGCTSLVEDITTDKCRTSLKKELQTWKADVVLHDGAPNVGKNWLFDAYQQICLTLQATKLASEFLRNGGWFITKVFRSKDYNALLWVLKQLFKKVHATKPSASRKESAEIFVVCQYFIAPDKIDPRFFEAKYVFEELDLEGTKTVSLLHPEKKRIKPEGYTEKDFSLRNELMASEFIKSTSALSALQGVSEIVFDDEKIASHKKTTNEIKECCKDIKVLGRKDLKNLISWWKVLNAEFYPKEQAKVEVETITEEKKKPLTQEEVEEMEFEEIEKQIEELETENLKDQKRKKKKVQEARRKLNEKINLKMVIKGDSGPQEEDSEVFSLKQINSAAQLESIQDMAPDMYLPDDDAGNSEFIPKYKKYERDSSHLDDDGFYADDDDNQNDSDDSENNDSDDSEELGKKGLGFDDESDQDDESQKKKTDTKKAKKVKKGDENPLLMDLDVRDKSTKRDHRVNLWFDKEKFKEMDADSEEGEDFDLDKLSHQYKTKGVKVLGESSEKEKEKEVKQFIGKKALRRQKYKENAGSDGNDTSDSDSDDDGVANDDGSGVKAKKIKLNEQELALGSMIVQSQKTKRDLFDAAWNRYTFNDENLPEWFVKDEALHMVKEAPVPKDLVDEYQKKVEELNVRPIKKVMEAKARKKRRAMKRFEKAKKKAESIMESNDASSQEKMRQIRKLYKKAQDKKEEISYVVARKHLSSKRVRRPAGVKGRFKVVDPRMKKEKRAAKAKEKTKNRRKH